MVINKSRGSIPISVYVYILIAALIIILLTFTLIEIEVNSKEYNVIDTNNYNIPNYKTRWESLVKDIIIGSPTGITSYDERGVTVYESIPIDLNEQAFVNLRKSSPINFKDSNGNIYQRYASVDADTKMKSHSVINGAGGGSPTANNAALFRSKLFWDNCTVYKDTGIVKLFDNYITVAIGTYFTNYYGLDGVRGSTYRVVTSEGATFNIIIVDYKGTSAWAPFSDKNWNNTGNFISDTVMDNTNKYSIGHRFSSENSFHQVCMIEFYTLNVSNKFPIYTYPTTSGSYTADYSSAKLATHSPQDWVNGIPTKQGNYHQYIPTRGSIQSITLIKDDKVVDLIEKCNSWAIENNISSGYMGTSDVYNNVIRSVVHGG